jgi:hypothetical protein
MGPETVVEAPAAPHAASTFDMDFSQDPFGQHRESESQTKVIQARTEAARSSGRLNIAALGLHEIPAAVMNMYEFDGSSSSCWAESVDLTRFVAADNEIEMLADSIFPDMEPHEMGEEDDDGKGNIFGGLETLDLHGNVLIALPLGLRRLHLLTSLNLVSRLLTSHEA